MTAPLQWPVETLPTEPVCPKCGYSASQQAAVWRAAVERRGVGSLADGALPPGLSVVRVINGTFPASWWEALDLFGCVGLDEGNMECPRCYEVFRWEPPEALKRETQGTLFE